MIYDDRVYPDDSNSTMHVRVMYARARRVRQGM
jgi:hypothetical protein